MVADHRTAVLVIRAWIEEAPGEETLRARITQTLDIESQGRIETAAASEDEILGAVANWLRAFAEPPVMER